MTEPRPVETPCGRATRNSCSRGCAETATLRWAGSVGDNREGHLRCPGSLSHPGLPSLQHQGRGLPPARGCRRPGVLLKGPHADSIHKHSAELQGRDRRLESPRDLRTDTPAGDMGFCTCTKRIGNPSALAEVSITHGHPPCPSQDKGQPETQATSFGSVLFNAKLAADDPEAIVLVNQPGSDGFKVDSTPLFQVGQRHARWLQCLGAPWVRGSDGVAVCGSWAHGRSPQSPAGLGTGPGARPRSCCFYQCVVLSPCVTETLPPPGGKSESRAGALLPFSGIASC